MNNDFSISGTWINRSNGDKITVRNTFIDGDNMIIQTTDGRQISMADFQNYIQMSDDEYDAQGHKVGSGSLDLGDIGKIEQERHVKLQPTRKVIDNSFEEPNFGFTEKRTVQETKTQKTEKESDKLLKKLFDKINLEVNVKVDLDCNNFPINELKMLQTIYDVNDEDISEYIIKNIINDDVYRSAVAEYIKEQLA